MKYIIRLREASRHAGRQGEDGAVVLGHATWRPASLGGWQLPGYPGSGRAAGQRDTFRKVVNDAFVPDLMAPDRQFRPGLRVKGVKAHANVFDMTWDNDGRATFSYGAERVPGQPHVIWRRIGTHDIFTPPPGP
jgi:hypothetical protein